MIQKFIQIIDQVVEDFNLDKNVVGVVLFGSLAKGKENSYSDIDLMVIAKKTEVKTTNELYGDTLVQMLWRTPEIFKDKQIKQTRFIPASKNMIVLLDKENWITDFLQSEMVKSTWNKPLSISEKEKLMMVAEFYFSLNQLKGFLEQDKKIETEIFISDFVYLGLELFYDARAWFIESKKYILSDIKVKEPGMYTLIEAIFQANTAEDKVAIYEKFYKEIMKIIGKLPPKYTFLW